MFFSPSLHDNEYRFIFKLQNANPVSPIKILDKSAISDHFTLHPTKKTFGVQKCNNYFISCPILTCSI